MRSCAYTAPVTHARGKRHWPSRSARPTLFREMPK
jgi:hypothetical protein